MEFEFDPGKSAANQEKHGIDFVEAQVLWQDSMYVEVPARTVDEPKVAGDRPDRRQPLLAVVTYRQEKIRIISLRRSRDEEVAIYESSRIRPVV